MKYDDYDYHVGGEFPDDVPDENAWTHIGVFLIWLIEHGLHDPAFFDDGRLGPAVAGIATRETQPSTFLHECDGVLVSEMLARKELRSRTRATPATSSCSRRPWLTTSTHPAPSSQG